MLDLELNERVATPSDIPDFLEVKGWHPAQVAGVWRVSSCKEDFSAWTENSLECLGGKGVLNKIWMHLKDRFLQSGDHQ